MVFDVFGGRNGCFVGDSEKIRESNGAKKVQGVGTSKAQRLKFHYTKWHALIMS